MEMALTRPGRERMMTQQGSNTIRPADIYPANSKVLATASVIFERWDNLLQKLADRPSRPTVLVVGDYMTDVWH
jgi:hypothetical protein